MQLIYFDKTKSNVQFLLFHPTLLYKLEELSGKVSGW